jgi:hypothetical protein
MVVSNTDHLIMTRKVALGLILLVSCLVTVYLASATLYLRKITGFADIKPGKISGSDYSFVIEEQFRDFFLQHNFNHHRVKLLATKRYRVAYTLLSHRGANYLIIKRSTTLVGIPQYAFFVWNITNANPYFVNSTTSCSDPKLVANRLEFVTFDFHQCSAAGEYRHDESIIELR